MRLLLPPRLLRPLLTLLLPRVTRLLAPPRTRALLLPTPLPALLTLLPAPPMRLPTLLLRPRKPLLRRSKRLL
jgi:hypothetical protein